MEKIFLLFMAVLLSCRTSSHKDSSPPVVPSNGAPNTPSIGKEEPDNPSQPIPASPSDAKPSPAVKTEELVGSCLRAKSNIPDAWLDCEQFYTGVEKSDYDRDKLYTIQKGQCEANQGIAASQKWFEGECPSSEKHKTCPKKTSWVNGVFGKRVFIRYQEAYKLDDCG